MASSSQSYAIVTDVLICHIITCVSTSYSRKGGGEGGQERERDGEEGGEQNSIERMVMICMKPFQY